MTIPHAITLALAEIDHARQKHNWSIENPETRDSERYLILHREVNEIALEVFRFIPADGNRSNLRTELAQVAACALRWLAVEVGEVEEVERGPVSEVEKLRGGMACSMSTKTKCSCTREAGDSDCAAHPTCPDCGTGLDGIRLTAERDALAAKLEEVTRERDEAIRIGMEGCDSQVRELVRHIDERTRIMNERNAAQDQCLSLERDLAAAIARAEKAERERNEYHQMLRDILEICGATTRQTIGPDAPLRTVRALIARAEQAERERDEARSQSLLAEYQSQLALVQRTLEETRAERDRAEQERDEAREEVARLRAEAEAGYRLDLRGGGA